MEKIKSELPELELLKKQLKEKDELIEALHKDNEELNLMLKAQESGEYAEPYTEDGIDYIITAPTVFDIKDKKAVIKTAEFFSKNRGFAARWAKTENSIIKLKGGNV